MRKGNVYRFTIQFGSITPRHEEVGEFLERLKNKKAEYIVQAVGEAMRRSGVHRPGDLPSVNPVAAPAEPTPSAQGPSPVQLDTMLESLDRW